MHHKSPTIMLVFISSALTVQEKKRGFKQFKACRIFKKKILSLEERFIITSDQNGVFCINRVIKIKQQK